MAHFKIPDKQMKLVRMTIGKTETKVKIVNFGVEFGEETWSMTMYQQDLLRTFERKMIRRI